MIISIIYFGTKEITLGESIYQWIHCESLLDLDFIILLV